MDSVRSARARPAEEALGRPPEASGRPTRLARAARGAVRAAWRLSAAGALGAAAVWAALFRPALVAGTVDGGLAVAVAAVLLVPAAAAALLAWTLGDVLALPGALRGAAADVRGDGRPHGLFRTVWALRGLAAEGAGAWARTAGLVRLASLPFVLALLGLTALNAVVAVAGAVALVALAL